MAPKRWRADLQKDEQDEPFYYRFFEGASVAYFRVATVMGREAYESAIRYSWGDPDKMLARYYGKRGKPVPPSRSAALKGIPSFFEVGERLLVRMKARRTEALIIDLQGNGGGVTPTVKPFLYQLYGDAYFRHRFESEFVTVHSALYRKKFQLPPSGASKGKDRSLPALGQYVFAAKRRERAPRESALRRRQQKINEYKRRGMSFAERLEGLNGRAIYTPPKVVVLCDADTFSAAFHFMYYLRAMGATVVGVTSSQSPNTFMEATPFVLSESGLRGSISNSAQIFTPNNPQARVLPPDFALTYDVARTYDFAEDAALRYAVDLIRQGKIPPRAADGRK